LDRDAGRASRISAQPGAVVFGSTSRHWGDRLNARIKYGLADREVHPVPAFPQVLAVPVGDPEQAGAE